MACQAGANPCSLYWGACLVIKPSWNRPSTAAAQVLALRQEKAELLGFKHFADVSMASKVCPLGVGAMLSRAANWGGGLMPRRGPCLSASNSFLHQPVHCMHACSECTPAASNPHVPPTLPPALPRPCRRWPHWRRLRSCWSSCGAPVMTPLRATCRWAPAGRAWGWLVVRAARCVGSWHVLEWGLDRLQWASAITPLTRHGLQSCDMHTRPAE